MKNYPWLNESYKIINNVVNKWVNIPYHLLLTAQYGSEENILIWHLTKTLLCTLYDDKTKDICSTCTSCKLIQQTNKHPDLYFLNLKQNDNFNNYQFSDLINYSQTLPVFCKTKLIIILYEKDTLNTITLDLINKLLYNITKYYTYIKIILKINLNLNQQILLSCLRYCLHIHIKPPSEKMCIDFLTLNYCKLKKRFNNVDLLTALRINNKSLNKTIEFLSNSWNLYIKFINLIIYNIKNQELHNILNYIISDIKNINLYLYWLIEFLLDIFKIICNTSKIVITNYKFYDILKQILTQKQLFVIKKHIQSFLQDICLCYTQMIKYPALNKEHILVDLLIKCKLTYIQ